MSAAAPLEHVASIEELESLYGTPSQPALVKEIDYVSDHYRQFIEAAPFVVMATSGPEGLDCSPRGDPPGFVRVHDRRTVMMPDRRGNNRLDSLRNLVSDPRISLLFLIPGVGETLRINGTAVLATDPALRESFAHRDAVPATVIVTTVERIYYQCPKALVRSRLWSDDARIPRDRLPTSGQIQRALVGGDFDAEAYDRAYPARLAQTLY